MRHEWMLSSFLAGVLVVGGGVGEVVGQMNSWMVAVTLALLWAAVAVIGVLHILSAIAPFRTKTTPTTSLPWCNTLFSMHNIRDEAGIRFGVRKHLPAQQGLDQNGTTPRALFIVSKISDDEEIPDALDSIRMKISEFLGTEGGGGGGGGPTAIVVAIEGWRGMSGTEGSTRSTYAWAVYGLIEALRPELARQRKGVTVTTVLGLPREGEKEGDRGQVEAFSQTLVASVFGPPRIYFGMLDVAARFLHILPAKMQQRVVNGVAEYI